MNQHRRRYQTRQSGYQSSNPFYHQNGHQNTYFHSDLHNNPNLYYQQYPHPITVQTPYYGDFNPNDYFQPTSYTPYPNPYPRPHPYVKQPGVHSLISQFKKSDGQLDINKMVDTAGQMISCINQMGGLFKGVTSMFK